MKYASQIFRSLMYAFLVLVLLVLVQGTASRVTLAEEKKEEKSKEETGQPVHITADRVKSDQKERWIEFIGNVRATQNEGVITAETLKIYYKPSADESADEATSSVDKLIAQGNVKIVFDGNEKTAVAEKAVYTAEDEVVVLTGGNPTVWSGENVVKGKKITLLRAEDRTIVEGSKKEQVEATFYSEGEGGLLK